MKKDIFNGKVKKEYISYLVTSYIVISVLFLPMAGGCVFLFVKAPVEGKFLFGLATLACVYLSIINPILTLFVIRQYPKHASLRKSLINSDIYFTDSTSSEYFGRTGTLRGRRNKAAFDLVTAVAELEAGMGDKQPIQYKVYNILSILMSVSGLILMIALPILYMNGVIRPIMSQNAFLLSCIAAGTVCVAIAIFFFSRAFETALMAPLEMNKWRSDLYTSLIDISIRQNNKKLKYWFDTDQLEQIENLVKAASKNAELKLTTKRDRLISFTVTDTSNARKVFKGLFI